MKIERLLFVVATIAITHYADAKSPVEQQLDSLKQSHQMIYFGDDSEANRDSVRAMIDTFYYDQFQHLQDPRTPYFMFMSKDASLAMGIGGCVRMRGWYDWGGVIPYNGFIPYAISVPKDDARHRKFATTPAGTALFFRVIGRNHRLGEYQLYIECNFDGYQQRDFHMKKAYATINDWTIGYALSTFSDLASQPVVVDAQGPNAEVQTTAVLLRWMHTFRRHWVVAASLETPDSRVAANGWTTGTIDDWVPNIAAFGQYQWGTGQHVRLSGIMRVLPYRDIISGSNQHEIGWGLQVSSVFRPIEPLTVYATVNGGRGYGSLTGDLQMDKFDLIDNPNEEGEMYAPASLGWYGALQYNFRPNLFASVVMGEMRYLPEHQVASDGYKYGLYGAVNIFWNPTPRLQLAAEVNLGKRQNFNGEHNYARRACMMCQFSF